jgi:hypothetical protein
MIIRPKSVKSFLLLEDFYCSSVLHVLPYVLTQGRQGELKEASRTFASIRKVYVDIAEEVWTLR